MAYTRTYRITNLNFNGVTCQATIFDRESFTPGIGIYQPRIINGAGNPITISSIDSDENKFTPIKGKKCTLQFNSSNSFNLSTFIEGQDNRWWIFVDAGTWNIFTGYLVLDDCREPYQPHPNVVTLVATDNLGLLKDAPLTDFDGKNPKGKYTIIQYIAMALAKTGLELEIKLIHNLVEESSLDNSPCFKDVYLDAKTFEGAEVGTSINCYDVLKRILGYDCILQQRNTQWWILRIDEMQAAAPVYPHLFTYQGNYIGSQNPEVIEYQIGSFRDSHFIQADQTVMLIRKHGFDKLTFNYNLPKELIDNQEFTRGDLLTPVFVEPKTVDNKNLIGAAYNLEDWTPYSGTFNNTSPGVGTRYIIRYFEDGVERERFIQLYNPTNNEQWIQSNEMPVHLLDKITDFKIDIRFPDKAAVLGTRVFFAVKLFVLADNGDIWILVGDHKAQILDNANPMRWELYTGNPQQVWQTFIRSAGGFDFSTFRTMDEMPPIPATGKFYITLPFVQQERVDYQNLTFKYTPYINGSYIDYKGQYNKTSVPGEYKANIEDEVFIGDSPKKLFKGALFKPQNGSYVLVGKFYNAAVFRTRPTEEYFNTYGKTQVYAVHNQYNRTFRIISGTIQNMNAQNGNQMPDSMRVYRIDETGGHAEGRRFMLANFSKNLRLAEWQATLIEVYGPEGKDYSATHEFKYV